MIALRTLAALATVAISSAAFAQMAAPTAEQRDANQQQRIAEGVQSGQLTRREAAHLQRHEAKVANVEARARADGVVTQREQAKIARKQDHASRAIERQKHDAQTARGTR